MYRMSFTDKWICWVKGCMESTSVSILVNGSPTNEFILTRGLRQGEPMTVFLFFLIVATNLVGLVKQTVKTKLLQGMRIGKDEVEVNILQFANDTLIMCEPSQHNIFSIKSILRCFDFCIRPKCELPQIKHLSRMCS